MLPRQPLRRECSRMQELAKPSPQQVKNKVDNLEKVETLNQQLAQHVINPLIDDNFPMEDDLSNIRTFAKHLFYISCRHRSPDDRIDHCLEANIKIEILEFHRSLKAKEFIDWLNTTERVFEYEEIPDHKKVKIVAIRLKGKASTWWEKLRITRKHRGKPKIVEWEKTKKKLKKQFSPFNYVQTHNVRQRSGSVEDHTKEFYEFLARNDLSESEEQIVAHYISGLRPNIQEVLLLHSFWSVSEAYQRALVVEK